MQEIVADRVSAIPVNKKRNVDCRTRKRRRGNAVTALSKFERQVIGGPVMFDGLSRGICLVVRAACAAAKHPASDPGGNLSRRT
jgi:hypothetical protein